MRIRLKRDLRERVLHDLRYLRDEGNNFSIRVFTEIMEIIVTTQLREAIQNEE